MPRFELSDGFSNKFWEIDLDGDSFNVRFGRIGTSGQTQRKSFATTEAAKNAMQKLINEKVAKGYRHVEPGTTTPPPANVKVAVAPAGKESRSGTSLVGLPDALAAFDTMLQERIAPVLKSRGFSRNGTTFKKRKGPNYGVVWFQKDKWNSRLEMRFTVEVGIASEFLSKVTGDFQYLPFPPKHTGYCQVAARLGQFLDPPHDKWWSIKYAGPPQELEAVCIEVLRLLEENGLPIVERSLSDEGLRDCILAGEWDYTSPHDHLIYAALLVKRYGPTDALQSLVQKLTELAPKLHRDLLELALQFCHDSLTEPVAEESPLLESRREATTSPGRYVYDLAMRNDIDYWCSWVANMHEDERAMADLKELGAGALLTFTTSGLDEAQVDWVSPDQLLEAARTLTAALKAGSALARSILTVYRIAADDARQSFYTDLEDLGKIAEAARADGTVEMTLAIDF